LTTPGAPSALPLLGGTIAFSHANGFPAGTYRLLFEAWQKAGWRVIAVPKFGHDAAYPVTGSWPKLREQLAAFIEAEAPGQRVHLVGHSLGGYLSLMVAARRPELAASVVLLDSPVLSGWRAHSLHVIKLTGQIHRVSPARVSRGRRYQWDSREAAFAHFGSKAVFARWQPAVLHDYVACGTEPDPDSATPGAVRLAFTRDVESRIYDTLPHRLMDVLRRHPIRVPVTYIGGTRSDEGRRVGLGAIRTITQGNIEWLDGTHLFPMERPAEAAAAVLKALTAASKA
jgi:pimeloyl-ACP methyl ester carboxylesterase